MDTRQRFKAAAVLAQSREKRREPIVAHALEQTAQIVEQCRRAGREMPAWWSALAPLTKLERARVRLAVAELQGLDATQEVA
jgi:hypothetical protein